MHCLSSCCDPTALDSTCSCIYVLELRTAKAKQAKALQGYAKLSESHQRGLGRAGDWTILKLSTLLVIMFF